LNTTLFQSILYTPTSLLTFVLLRWHLSIFICCCTLEKDWNCWSGDGCLGLKV